MKKWFKTCAICLLALSLILPSAVGVTYASSESPLSSGETGLMVYLGIMTDEEQDFDREITRGELAYIAARTAGAVQNGSDRVFYDVPAEHPYYNEINALAEAGVINGTGGGYFSPAEAVSFEAACKVFSSLLGYGSVAPAYDWVKVAKGAGIIDGVKTSAALSYGQAILMAYNTLHGEMLEGTVYGDGITYDVQKGYLALERYHRLIESEGILDGYFGTTLTHPKSVRDGFALIDGEEYAYDGGEALIGRAVVFYTEPDSREIEYIYADEDKNNIVTVAADDIIGKNGSTFNYYVGDKKKSATISNRETDVLINGVAYPDYTSADLSPAAGSVTLIDNDDDKVYEVIVVESYVYMILKGIDTDNYVLYGEYPAITVGDASRESVFFEVHKDGKLIYPKNLKSGDAVAVKESKNTDGTLKLSVDWLVEAREGYVEKISSEVIAVGGTEYRLSSAAVNDGTVSVGDYVSIYTHLDECAVMLHPENESFKIGYLVGAEKDGDAFESSLRVQLIDANKDIHVFDVAERLNLDGRSLKDADTILTKLGTTAALTYATNGWDYSQLVRYRLSNDGVLTHLDTMYYDAAKETEDSLQQRTDGGASSELLLYNTSNRSFYDRTTGEFKFSVRNSADAIWGISRLNRDEPDWYVNWLTNNGQYTVEPYNLDNDTHVADYVVAYITKYTTVSDAAPLYVVTECETTLNDEGEEVKTVTLLGNGSEKTVQKTLAANISDTELAVGDVVQWREDNRGKQVCAIKVIWSPNRVPDETDRYYENGSAGSTLHSIQLRMAYGTIKAKSGSFVTHTTAVAEDLHGVTDVNLNNYLYTGSAKIYIYDKSGRVPTVKVGSLDDIVPYNTVSGNPDKAIISEEYGVLKMIYLIKD